MADTQAHHCISLPPIHKAVERYVQMRQWMCYHADVSAWVWVEALDVRLL